MKSRRQWSVNGKHHGKKSEGRVNNGHRGRVMTMCKKRILESPPIRKLRDSLCASRKMSIIHL